MCGHNWRLGVGTSSVVEIEKKGTVEGNERRGTWKTTRCRFESNDRRSRTLWSWDFSVRAIGTKKLF